MGATGINKLMHEATGRFDGHAHVFNTTLPMIASRRYTPQADALLDDYIALLQAHNLNGALLVQPSFLGTDNSYLLEALSHANSRQGMCFKGVAVVDSALSHAALSTLSDAGVVGIRFNCIGTGNAISLDEWQSVLQFAANKQWHVEVHAQGTQLPGLLDSLLAHCPRIVVDHFGLPDAAAPLHCPGQRAIRDAPHGQVFVKVSAPYRVFLDRNSSDSAALCEPLITQLLADLGPEQLVWGSDWPWTQHEKRHSYRDCLQWGLDTSPEWGIR